MFAVICIFSYRPLDIPSYTPTYITRDLPQSRVTMGSGLKVYWKVIRYLRKSQQKKCHLMQVSVKFGSFAPTKEERSRKLKLASMYEYSRSREADLCWGSMTENLLNMSDEVGIPTHSLPCSPPGTLVNNLPSSRYVTLRGS